MKINVQGLYDTLGFLTGLLCQGSLVDQEQAKAASAFCLSLVQPHTPMGEPLFNEFRRHATNVACEGVLFRTAEGGTTEVFLTTHPRYPGELVGMGSVARAGEEYGETLARLKETEFGAPTTFDYVGESHFVDGDDYLCRIYLAGCEGEPKTQGAWYPAESLPGNVRQSHVKMIQLALEEYKKGGRQP